MESSIINYFVIFTGEGFNFYAPYEIILPYTYSRIETRRKEHGIDYPYGEEEHYIQRMI